MPNWNDEYNGNDGTRSSQNSYSGGIEGGYYFGQRFRTPDYLKDAIDRASSDSIKAQRLSAATLKPTLASLINRNAFNEKLAGTGTSGGFRDKMVSQSDMMNAITLQDVLTQEESKYETENLALQQQLNDLELNWRNQRYQQSMMDRQVTLQEKQYEDETSLMSWIKNLF